jgi:WD40 repeat protein
VQIFLSFNSKDLAFADALRSALSNIEPEAKIFFSPVSLGTSFWLPRLAQEIAEADAFLLLIGPKGIGPWQEVEYFTAFDRHVNDKRFVLVPVILAGAEAPGLSFLRNLNWVEAPCPSDDKLLHRLISAAKGETIVASTPLWKLLNPYRGLEAMTEANADYFFGRRAETTAILNELANNSHRCPILIGASGVGKSSVAQAGVLSALKSMRWPETATNTLEAWPRGLQNSRSWVWLTMRPGETPLETLAATLIRLWQLDGKDPDLAALPRKWAKGLAAGDNTLADLIGATQDVLKEREGEAPGRILLYLDQAEELYTRASDREAQRFSEVLAKALGDPRFSAFASLRADYFDRLQADAALFECHAHVNVPPLDRIRLHEVVTAPARSLSVAFEDGKVAERITNAAAAEPGALPLLSYLLTDMWTDMVRRGDAKLRLPAEAIDVGGVLATHAEDFLKGNPNEESALRRLLTLKLSIVPPEGEAVRRQTHRDECTEAEWWLAARLAEYPWRLVVMGEREVDDRVVAEVAHEALLRAWPRLRDWLRNERDFLIFKGEAERAERRWRGLGQVDKALLTGLDLARSMELLPARSQDLSPQVTAFLQRSIAFEREQREVALAQEQARLAEIATAQARTARSQKIARWTLAVMSAMVMLAVGLGALQYIKTHALQASLATREEANKALQTKLDTRQLVIDRLQANLVAELAGIERLRGNLVEGLRLAVLAARLDLAAVTRASTASAAATEITAALSQSAWILNLPHAKGSVTSGTFSPDGSRVVMGSWDNSARIWDAATGKQIAVLRGHKGPVEIAAFSPDGSRIVTASRDGTARLWDPAAGKEITAVDTGLNYPYYEKDNIALSPDGSRIALAFSDNTAHVLNADTGKGLAVLRDHGDAHHLKLNFSPDGLRIVTTSSNSSARIWDALTGNEIAVLRIPETETVINSAVFSPNGLHVLTVSSDNSVRIWDTASVAQIAILPRFNKWVSFAVFSPDGAHFLTASGADVQIWDAATATETAVLRDTGGYVDSAGFSRDGSRIVTVSRDYAARVWDASTGKQTNILRGQYGMTSAAFNPNGTRIITASADGMAWIWDATFKEIGSLRNHDKEVMSAAFSPNGSRIITASFDTTARIWDSKTLNETVVLRGHEDRVHSAAFSPDGSRAVTASYDNTARIWDTANGKQIAILRGNDATISRAAFSPDGSRMVTASSDGKATIWDAKTGAQIAILLGHELSVNSAAYSPDGSRIATASEDYTVRIWDALAGTQLMVLNPNDYGVLSASFSPDGLRIVSTGRKSAHIWDATTGKEIRTLTGHGRWVTSVQFSPNGSRIVTSSEDGTARIWDATSGKELSVLRGHEGIVNSAAFSPDGIRIITASEDKTAKIWSIHFETMSEKDLLEEACTRRLIDLSKMTSDEMSIAGYPDDSPEIDVCAGISREDEVNTIERLFASAYRSRCDTYREEGDYARATIDCAEAIRLDPSFAPAYLSRGVVNYSQKNYDLAIEDYTQAIRINPRFALAFVNRAAAYGEKDDHYHSIEDSSRAIELEPKESRSFNARCWEQATIGKLQAALADCNESLRLQPDDANALDSRGFTYLRLAQFDDAIADYDAALELQPKSAYSLYGRGLAKLRKGDVDGGSKDIAAAKTIKPDIDAEFVRLGVN